MAQQQIKRKRGPPIQTLPNQQNLHLIGFGTYKLQDQQQLTQLLRKGLQIGYCKHIDTARYYNNQIPLGKAIKTVINQGRIKRQQLFIATKCFNSIHQNVVLSVKQSLKLMQLDYVDLLYLHWPLVDTTQNGQWLHKSLTQVWKQFQLCVKKGYAKYLGISNFNGQLLNQLLSICQIKPIALQIQTHPYLPCNNIVQVAQKKGIYVIAHTPLGRGQSQAQDKNILKQDIIVQMAQKHGKTPAQIVLKYNLHRKVGVIPKSSNVNRLKQNFQCWTVDLSQQDMKKIRNITKKIRVCDGKGLFKDFSIFDH